MSVLSRLTRLQEAAEKAKNGKIKVTFADGHIEYHNGGECVVLWHDSAPGTLERFEACGPGHGLLPDLLNDLLD